MLRFKINNVNETIKVTAYDASSPRPVTLVLDHPVNQTTVNVTVATIDQYLFVGDYDFIPIKCSVVGGALVTLEWDHLRHEIMAINNDGSKNFTNGIDNILEMWAGSLITPVADVEKKVDSPEEVGHSIATTPQGCECGAWVAGSPKHSDYCKLYKPF